MDLRHGVFDRAASGKQTRRSLSEKVLVVGRGQGRYRRGGKWRHRNRGHRSCSRDGSGRRRIEHDEIVGKAGPDGGQVQRIHLAVAVEGERVVRERVGGGGAARGGGKVAGV